MPKARKQMKSYEASATIEAPPEAGWNVLVDGGSYTDWDSGVLALEGDIALGERLKVTSEANPKRAFPVRVTEVEPARSMRWSGGRAPPRVKRGRAVQTAPP